MTARALSRLILVLCGLALTVGPSRPAAADPLAGPLDQRSTQQVTALFATVRDAVAKGDGNSVLSHLTRGSQSRLEAIRSAAKLGSAAPLSGLAPSEKLGVLGLRRHFSPAQLRHLLTPDLVISILSSRGIHPDMVREAELGPIKLSGNRASAPILIKGQPSLARAEFEREAGQWRIDLSRSTATADTLLRVLTQLSGQGEEAYLSRILDRARHK